MMASGKVKDDAFSKGVAYTRPRKYSALERDWRTADKRYKNEKKFRALCDHWLPVIEQAVKDDTLDWQSITVNAPPKYRLQVR